MKYGRKFIVFYLCIQTVSLLAMDVDDGSVVITDTDSFIDLVWASRTQSVLQAPLDCPSEETKPFTALSVFKQQLLYHNRLPVKITKQAVVTPKVPKQFIVVAEVVIKESDTETPRTTLNELANDLVGVIGKTYERVLSSGWVLKAETDYYILNPLHLAIKHGLDGCVKRLLSEGANANAPDHLGRPPLHMVALLDDEELQKQLAARLLFYSARIDAPNQSGDTALTIAVQQEKDIFVDMLLDRGADPNINVNAEFEATQSYSKDEPADVLRLRCASGTSPLWAAVSCNRIVPAALLLRKKAQLKSTERLFAQQMHDTTQDESHKLLLAKVLTISHH